LSDAIPTSAAGYTNIAVEQTTAFAMQRNDAIRITEKRKFLMLKFVLEVVST